MTEDRERLKALAEQINALTERELDELAELLSFEARRGLGIVDPLDFEYLRYE